MLTKTQFLNQLNQLISFKTMTENTTENNMALDYVQTLINPKAKLNRLVHDGSSILLASNFNTITPELGYLVHMDVVSASDQMFTMTEKKGVVTGRGVSDMKFSIPIGVALLNELIETNSSLSFCLAITTDEEIGGFKGGAYLANQHGWRPKALIVPDGGDNLKFVNKAKGVIQFSLTSKGKSAHASRPWDGVNALTPLCLLISQLNSIYGMNNFSANWETTLNIGQLHGGTSTNQVCNQAILNLDYRYPETDSINRIKTQLTELVKDLDANIDIEIGSTGLPTYTNPQLPIVKQFLDCLQQTTNKTIPITPTYGASDARHFAPFNIPVLMIKPNGGDIHCETEYLEIQSTMDFYQGLRKFLKIYSNKGSSEIYKNS